MRRADVAKGEANLMLKKGRLHKYGDTYNRTKSERLLAEMNVEQNNDIIRPDTHPLGLETT